MKYIDRKGNITIEENRQDKFLRHLYNDWGGRLCLKIIIQPFVTRLGGWFLNTRLSARMIPGFVERNHIDLLKKLHLADQPADFCHPLLIFLLGRNIGIIKKYCNRKKPGKIFQDITAAGRTACMKKKSGNLSFFLMLFD